MKLWENLPTKFEIAHISPVSGEILGLGAVEYLVGGSIALVS